MYIWICSGFAYLEKKSYFFTFDNVFQRHIQSKQKFLNNWTLLNKVSKQLSLDTFVFI
jgi:hypothetical protein